MELFDETNSKYYEFIIEKLKVDEQISEDDLKDVDSKLIEIINNSDLFEYDKLNRIYKLKEIYLQAETIDQYKFPVLLNKVERQALKSLVNDKYNKYFLNESTINKIKELTKDELIEWDNNDLTIKNILKSKNGNKDYYQVLKILREAIEDKTAIDYEYPYKGKTIINTVYPYRLEYDTLDDQIRVDSYLVKNNINDDSNRFIKSNLEKMSNVVKNDDKDAVKFREAYDNYLKEKKKKVTLKMKAEDYRIELCFKVFSSYEREATYNEDNNVYTLTITYLEAEEKNIIKNILSLGRSVIVEEPQHIKDKVIEEIKKSLNNYEGER